MELLDYKTSITFRTPIKLVQKLQDFQRRYNKKTLTDAIIDLLETGLFVESKLGLAETLTPDIMIEIERRLEDGTLVDYVGELDQKKFRHIVNIMREEERIRNADEKKQKKLFA